LQSAIFNSANFPSIATDAKGVIQIFNVGAERMLGYGAAEVMQDHAGRHFRSAGSDRPRQGAHRRAGHPITPGFEALVHKASRGIEDIYELTYPQRRQPLPGSGVGHGAADARDAIIAIC
jgi:PAS domain-containing protein